MQITLNDDHAFFELAREHFQRAERFSDGVADDVAVSVNLQMHAATADLRVVQFDEKLAQRVKRLVLHAARAPREDKRK